MAVREAQPGKRVELWFQDEARVGNKGRVCHRWWRRGERARGPKQIGYKWAYIYTLVHPESGGDFTLVLPFVNADLMNLFLACFAATLPEDVHVVIVLDGAGWHDPRALDIPDNLTLVFQPPTVPNSIPSSGCGSISKSVSCRSASSTIPTPSSTPAAPRGKNSSTKKTVSNLSAHFRGS